MLLGTVVAGCSSWPLLESAPEPAVEARQWCRDQFARIDAQVRNAGLRDAGTHYISDYPYLRADRFLASLASQTDSPVRYQAWLDRLADLDRQVRGVELANLDARGVLGEAVPTLQRRLAHCRAALIEAELGDARGREQIIAAAQVPDDYSLLQRTLGLYPLAIPFLKLGINNFQRQAQAEFASPLPADGGRLIQWWPEAGADISAAQIQGWIASAASDPLGVPQITGRQWEMLAAEFAPVFLIDSQSSADQPGSPIWQDGVPTVDRTRPQVFVVTGFAQLGQRILPQISYTIWFSERPPEDGFDPYAGKLDGVTWRVTLGDDGQPLAYDTIHACGCYHYVFPTRPMQPRPAGSFSEPVLVPQAIAPMGQVAVRLAAGSHYVTKVIPAAELHADAPRAYRLASYRSLLSITDERGWPRPLFSSDEGLVAGSERAERYYLWPSGVRSPGTMRQWGRHATAFVGRRHFDDPDLLCEVLACP